jgi:hypothetical protein
MNKQDLIKEFNNSIAIVERTTASYQKEYIGFLEEKYIQTENRHQVALGVASNHSDIIIEKIGTIKGLGEASKIYWGEFVKANGLLDEKDEQIKALKSEIDQLEDIRIGGISACTESFDEIRALKSEVSELGSIVLKRCEEADNLRVKTKEQAEQIEGLKRQIKA